MSNEKWQINKSWHDFQLIIELLMSYNLYTYIYLTINFLNSVSDGFSHEIYSTDLYSVVWGKKKKEKEKVLTDNFTCKHVIY